MKTIYIVPKNRMNGTLGASHVCQLRRNEWLMLFLSVERKMSPWLMRYVCQLREDNSHRLVNYLMSFFLNHFPCHPVHLALSFSPCTSHVVLVTLYILWRTIKVTKSKTLCFCENDQDLVCPCEGLRSCILHEISMKGGQVTTMPVAFIERSIFSPQWGTADWN